MAPAPTLEDLTALVRTLLAEIMDAPVAEIPIAADMVDDLDLDSLQQLELMARVEAHLDVRLDVEDWRNGRSVLELAERVRLQLAPSAPG